MMIRPYQATDESQVVELWRQCNLLVPWNDPHREIAAKMQVQPELFLVGVLEADGQPDQVVATVLAGYDGHRGWLYSLAVAPTMQRQGCGRSIVGEAEARLKALGCRKVNLQVRETNTAVVRFYEKLGYTVEPRISLGKRL